MKMNKEKKEIKEYYIKRASRLAEEISVRKTRNRAFVGGELLAFCSAVAAFVAWA